MASTSDPAGHSKIHSDSDDDSPKANPPPETASRPLEGYPQSSPPPAMAGHQPPQPYYPGHPPQAMGYPPVMGYPPNQYPGAPPYNHNYGQYPNYGGAPHPPMHGGYYANPGYMPPHGQPMHQQRISPSGFARGVLVAIVILIIVTAMFSIITYVFIRPEEPVFRLASFSITNFNISNSAIMATWEANAIVENHNDKLRAYLDRVQSYVYYKVPGEYLAYNFEAPVSLDKKGNASITLRVSMINNEQPRSVVVDDIDKERKGGSVSFGLGIRMLGSFTSSSSLTLHENIRVACDDLKVAIAPGSTNGTLVFGDKPKECSVYVT